MICYASYTLTFTLRLFKYLACHNEYIFPIMDIGFVINYDLLELKYVNSRSDTYDEFAIASHTNLTKNL